MIRELKFEEIDSHFFNTEHSKFIPEEQTITISLKIIVDPKDVDNLRNRLLDAIKI